MAPPIYRYFLKTEPEDNSSTDTGALHWQTRRGLIRAFFVLFALANAALTLSSPIQLAIEGV